MNASCIQGQIVLDKSPEGLGRKKEMKGLFEMEQEQNIFKWLSSLSLERNAEKYEIL